MKILALCKRQYTGKDLLDDRYGRLYELLTWLAEKDFSINALVLSYRRRPGVFREEGDICWYGVGLCTWLVTLLKIIRRSRPTLILASSDALHVIVGVLLGRLLAVPVVVDLYDDYEAFALTRFPFLRGVYRRACEHASLIVTVSQKLADVLASRHSRLPVVCVIRNGVTSNFSRHLNKTEARRKLGLPVQMELVGTAGALSYTRGIADLFAAWQEISAQKRATSLVIAGPRDNGLNIPVSENIIDMGNLPHNLVPVLFRALDVGIICNKPSQFGLSCHPLKLVEMVACGLPVVAADVGEVSCLLNNTQFSLYPPGDHKALAKKVLQQLATPRTLSESLAKSWKDRADELRAAILSIV